MLKDITLGQYFPGDSIIHKLDPRIKIITTFLFVAAVFSVRNYAGYVPAFIYIAAAAAISGISIKYLVSNLKPLYFIIILTFVINAFFTRGETVIFTLWGLSFTQEGLSQGIFMILRIVFLVLGTSLLTLTTSPISLTDGLEHLFRPLKRIGFPAHEISMMTTIALRFIPTLIEETDKIMKAQMARGADFESGNLFVRAKALVPLLVPLFISAFRRADELAMAMESRCYRGGENRTRMNTLKAQRRDLVAIIATFIMITLVLAASWF
jgi:energy-coupling factor transport system permease protein